ncbi:MAG TPA: DUF4339 domain-containing protein [Kiritimatiellia bacterium]|nr:DUF4339 domain-containing protein [Kiritimatiellia bacterium]
MEKIWYYAEAGMQQGPVDFDELRARAASGALQPYDLVWQPAFGDSWRSAGEVPGLFVPQFVEAPPPSDHTPLSDVPLTGLVGTRPSGFSAAVQAFERMRAVLFRAFDITRWFSIGFCAWIAYIGSQSSVPDFSQAGGAASTESFKEQIDGALRHSLSVLTSPPKLALIASIVLVVLALALLFCRLRSRGDFMFLHRWYRPDASISQCWWASRASGHELFVWRVYFFLIAALLFILTMVAGYGMVVRPYIAAGYQWHAALVKPTVVCVTVSALFSIAVQVIAHLAKAFVVPVMYWHGVSASRAWLAVFSLFNQHPFAVLGYLCCGMLCSLFAGFVILGIGLLTCCVGFIPLMLPYLGAVAMLPYTYFFRGYAVCFLSQWRPDLVPASA